MGGAQRRRTHIYCSNDKDEPVSDLQAVRGTRDLMGEDLAKHRRITDRFRNLAERYGFDAIDTPIFEFTEVFKRTLGETTDVVTKEMYTFDDKGGDSITQIGRASCRESVCQHV